MDKEQKWLQRRLGMITASELGNITSASGKIIDGNLSYIRQKRWERKHGFSHPVTARAMEIGNEQEPYINEWCKANLGLPEIVYSKDLPEIPFWVATDCPVGASPDAFTPDERIELEYKTLVGNTAIEFFGDEYTSYEEKKLAVWKDHGDQLLGKGDKLAGAIQVGEELKHTFPRGTVFQRLSELGNQRLRESSLHRGRNPQELLLECLAAILLSKARLCRNRSD